MKDYPIKPLGKGVREDFLKQWGNPELPNLVISHDKCHDGYGAVASVLTYCEDNKISTPEIAWYQYNQYSIDEVVDKVRGKVVLIGDFSFRIEEYQKIMESAHTVITVDHHKTPYLDAVSELPNTYFDMNKAGALLTWEFLFPNGEAQIIIKVVADRDIYKFEYGINTKATYQMLVKHNMPNDPMLVKSYIDNEEQLVLDFSEYIPDVELYEKQMGKRAEQAEEYNIKGVKMFGMNYTSKASDVLNMVSAKFGTPSISYFIANGRITFSLRNATDAIDVSKIAEQFPGGGGHEQAAGFSLGLNELDLKEFFVNKIIK